MSYQLVLDEISGKVKYLFGTGAVADYIPALALVNPEKFGMAVATIDGDVFQVGDSQEGFSIQSISKLIGLTLAMSAMGESLWTRVGKMPAIRSFNTWQMTDISNCTVPANPFINAGALVVTDCLISNYQDPKLEIVSFSRVLSGSLGVKYDPVVVASEAETAFTNRKIAKKLKASGNIHNSIEDVLDLYFHQCSIKMSCVDLAKAFLFLANKGAVDIQHKKILVSSPQAKQINTLMLTCGTYNGAGEFAHRIGLPSKSGVGGGIISIILGVASICVWSPELDSCGNSVVGSEALELFTTMTGKSIF